MAEIFDNKSAKQNGSDIDCPLLDAILPRNTIDRDTSMREAVAKRHIDLRRTGREDPVDSNHRFQSTTHGKSHGGQSQGVGTSSGSALELFNQQLLLDSASKRKRDTDRRMEVQRLAIVQQVRSLVKGPLAHNVEALVARAAQNSPSGIQASPDALNNVVRELVKELRGLSAILSVQLATQEYTEIDVNRCLIDEVEALLTEHAGKEFGEDSPTIEVLVAAYRAALDSV